VAGGQKRVETCQIRMQRMREEYTEPEEKNAGLSEGKKKGPDGTPPGPTARQQRGRRKKKKSAAGARQGPRFSVSSGEKAARKRKSAAEGSTKDGSLRPPCDLQQKEAATTGMIVTRCYREPVANKGIRFYVSTTGGKSAGKKGRIGLFQGAECSSPPRPNQ